MSVIKKIQGIKEADQDNELGPLVDQLEEGANRLAGLINRRGEMDLGDIMVAGKLRKLNAQLTDILQHAEENIAREANRKPIPRGKVDANGKIVWDQNEGDPDKPVIPPLKHPRDDYPAS